MNFTKILLALAAIALTEAHTHQRLHRRYGNDTVPGMDSMSTSWTTATITTDMTISSTTVVAAMTSSSTAIGSITSSIPSPISMATNTTISAVTGNATSVMSTSSSSSAGYALNITGFAPLDTAPPGSILSSTSVAALTTASSSSVSTSSMFPPSTISSSLSNTLDSPSTTSTTVPEPAPPSSISTDSGSTVAAAVLSSISFPAISSLVSSTTTDVITSVTNQILTFTQGSGFSKTVITTTLHLTKTFTVTNTITIGLEVASTATPASVLTNLPGSGHSILPPPMPADISSAAVPTQGLADGNFADASSAGQVTTITDLSTTTATITVLPAGPSVSGEAPPIGQVLSQTTAGANDLFGSTIGACGITTVTMTTVIKSTITITAAPTMGSGPSSLLPPMPSVSAGQFFGNGTGNGTDTMTPKHMIASTGFITSTMPFILPTGYRA